MLRRIKDWLGRRSDAQTVVAEPVRPAVNADALAAAGLRVHQWVVAAGQLGIVIGTCDEGALVALTKENGENLMELGEDDKPVTAVRVAPLEDIRVAYIEEIPAARLPDHEVARALGYEGRP